jgi:hypothetical protein
LGVLLQVSFERVEAAGPVRAIRLEPSVQLGERVDPEPIPALLALGPDRDEPGLPKDFQMLRDAGLAEPEVVDQLTDGALALPQEIEDLAAVWLGEGGVRSHP